MYLLNFLLFLFFEIQYLEVSNERTQSNQKSKEEIQQNINKSLVNKETHSADKEKKARMVKRPENATKIIQEFEVIIKSNKKSLYG